MFRKFAAILLCVTMTVGMTGCQKSGAGETSKPQNENKTENAQGKSEDQSGKTEGDESAQGNSEDPAGNGADEGNGSGEEVTIPMILTTGTNDAQDIVTGKIVDDFMKHIRVSIMLMLKSWRDLRMITGRKLRC